MPDEPLLLGIDVGTTNCKALVFDTAGRPLAAALAPTPTLSPRPGWAEYDPEAIWSTVATVVRQALGQIDAARVRGVAVASMGEAGLLLDGAGRPLTPVLAWYDSRSDPYYRWWLDHIGADSFLPVAGNRPNPIFSVFKLMWLRDHAPTAYAAAARWLHMADYVAFRLCGAQATDYSLATRTMLLDLPRLRWSEPIIAAAGLRGDLLPEAVPAGTRVGAVHAAAAAATGLPLGIAVGVGGHDHICGALAAGACAEGIGLDSMGTAEPAFLPLDRLRLDTAAGRCSFGAHVVPGKYYAAKGLRVSGAATAWAGQLLAFTGDPAGAAYERMLAAAAQAPPGSRGAMFLPRLAAIDRGAFVGLTADIGPAELGRAVYEGLAYEWRGNLETIEAAVGIRAWAIRLIGGGARAAVWVQIKADVLGRPLHVLGQSESVARGAALLGGIAAGVYRDAPAAALAVRHHEQEVTPDPARAAFYDRRYREVYVRLAPALGELHELIAQLALEPIDCG
jgi:xylulokinase